MKYISRLSKETFFCNELQVKDYKEILKCCYGEEPNKLIFVETICEVVSKIVNKPIGHIKSLNIVDLFCLILDIRFNCLGVCNVTLKQGDDQFNIELNLGLIKEEISELFNILSTTIEYNGLEIVFECPSIERLLQNTNEDYLPYIKSSYINKNNTKKFIEITTNKQAELLFDKISPKISLELIQKFNTFVERVTKMNFLSRYGFKDQQLTFVPSLDSLIWFMKIMFSENLTSFYENVFYLSYTGKMNAEYIENTVVGEYNYYLALLRQATASNKSSEGEGEMSEDPGLYENEM